MKFLMHIRSAILVLPLLPLLPCVLGWYRLINIGPVELVGLIVGLIVGIILGIFIRLIEQIMEPIIKPVVENIMDHIMDLVVGLIFQHTRNGSPEWDYPIIELLRRWILIVASLALTGRLVRLASRQWI